MARRALMEDEPKDPDDQRQEQCYRCYSGAISHCICVELRKLLIAPVRIGGQAHRSAEQSAGELVQRAEQCAQCRFDIYPRAR